MNSIRTLTREISLSNIAQFLYATGVLNDNEEVLNERDTVLVTLSIGIKKRGIEIIRNEP